MSRYSQKHRHHRSSDSWTAMVRELDRRAPTDLANKLTPKVSVSCLLCPEGITWGTYRNDTVAIFELQLRAYEPPGYKLRHFQLSLKFSSQPTTTAAAAAAAAAATPNPGPSIWLLQHPSPSPQPEYVEGRPWTETQQRGLNIEPNVQAGVAGASLGSYARTTEKSIQHKWRFRSYSTCDENNCPTTATWIWESNKNNSDVDDRGVLHAAAAVCYDGDSAPLTIECHVEGKLCKGASWLRFGTEKAEPARWSKKTVVVADNIEDALKGLKSKIETLNIGAPARETLGSCMD